MKKFEHLTEGITNTVLMIEPVAFGYNPETAVNNYFQQEEKSENNRIQKLALNEFQMMVSRLREVGIQVIVIKDTLYPHTPDSIFPNNWISFHLNNHVVFYPMFAENRRLERRMDILLDIEKQLERKFHYTDYSTYELKNIFLEGTGSIVPDRHNRIAYAGISPRTDKDLFLKFCREMNFKPVYFNATQIVDGKRLPIYHTNVMMCMGDRFAVVCLETIDDEKERDMLIAEFTNSGKEIVEISMEQMNQFAGNMIQLKNDKDEKFLLLSQTAYDSLTQEQIHKLEQFNRLIVNPVPTIEKNGGGSVRCMVAEVF